MANLAKCTRVNNFSKYYFLIAKHQENVFKPAVFDFLFSFRFRSAGFATLKCWSSTWRRAGRLSGASFGVPGAVRETKHLYCTARIDIKQEIESISEKFSESLELLNDAKCSLGTVYFSEDMKDAEKMVEETLLTYRKLMEKLKENEKLDVQRTIGLKMEELQAQLQMIKDSIKE